ncbi:MAG: hypothetical protein MJ191_00030 [Clostridium sp.]|nr:hypothetical protein [Clostridium sp.]
MTKEAKEQCWAQFKALQEKAISMNHYDLARTTSIQDIELWKEFLIDPEVTAYIERESEILTKTELRKLASDVSDSRSVGQAQLINAMSKLADIKTAKEGPIFIYSYVPLNKNQKQAENVVELEEDIFQVEEAPMTVENDTEDEIF